MKNRGQEWPIFFKKIIGLLLWPNGEDGFKSRISHNEFF